MNTVNTKIYTVCDWISKLASITGLWFLFTLMGLGILGIMPATSALFSITRKWVHGEEVSRLFKTYWNYYRRAFKETNFLGLVFLVIGRVLIINFQILTYDLSSVSTIILISNIVIALVYIMMLINFFPVYVHFDLPMFKYFKQTFTITFFQPIRTLTMLLWVVLVLIISMFLPILILFFTPGLMGFGMNLIAQSGFSRMHSKNTENTVS